MQLGLVTVVAVLIGGLSVTTAYGQASTTTFLNKFTFSDGSLIHAMVNLFRSMER